MTSPPTTPKTRRQSFNMVEVILALVIVLLGVVSLMALFPIGNTATKDAIGQSAAADAGSQFLSYYSSKVKQRWALLNAVPISKPGPDESDVRWANADANNIISGVEGLTIFYNDEAGNGAFDYVTTAKDDSGLFKLRQSTAQSLDDFSAILRVWKTPAQFNALGAAATVNQAVTPSTGVTLNVEVSWPAEIAYEKRQKKVFPMDIFRPNENTVDEVEGAFRIAEAGRLRVTYHGSDAGWRSELWMTYPDETQIFESNQNTDQNTTTDFTYTAGQEFNFNTLTHSPKFKPAYAHYAWAPEPIECDCTCRHISGELNINPSNSSNNEFYMILGPGGVDPENGDNVINRADLHQRSPHNTNGVYYQGPATFIAVRPKGNGNQNTFMADGAVYPLENKQRYEFSGDMNVIVYNDKIKNGKAMGHWWLKSDSDCASIRPEGQAHDARCASLPGNRGQASAQQAVPFYDDWPNGKYSGAHDVVSGNPYCLVVELEPARKWLLRYEDQPGHPGCDWDYNDIVITVELLVEDGISNDLSGVPASGDVNLDPNSSSDWRVSVVKTDGTTITDGDLAGGYDGPALALWMQPRGSGTQTISVDGEDMSVNNNGLISIVSSDLDVRIYKSGNSWRADFDATDAYVTVME